MTKVKCQKCKKEWETKSKNVYVSCPSCLTKVKVNKDEESYIDMDKKTKIKYVYQKKVLQVQNVCGIDKGEVDDNRIMLSKVHNIPVGEIRIEFI
jgi:DNA-directed RNA polymerase subunit RPC12/RpoP